MDSEGFYRYLLGRGFEERKSQREMIKLCEEVIEEGGVKLIEAPTGTGKTFAYLIPVITSGRGAIISTGTKILQDQLRKDIEFLTGHWKVLTGEEVTYAVLKGKGNYLCLDRYYKEGKILEGIGNVPDLLEREWDGDLTLTSISPEAVTKVNVDDDYCSKGYREVCPYREKCYYWERLKERERKSRILVVNHSLLALKDFEETQERVLIIDEAHELDRYLTLAVTGGISTYWVREVKSTFEKYLERDLSVDPEKIFSQLFSHLFEEEETEEVALESLASYAQALKDQVLSPFEGALKDLTEKVREQVRSFLEGRLMVSHRLKYFLEKTFLFDQEFLSAVKGGYEDPDEEERQVIERVKKLEFLDRKVQKLSAFLRICLEEREDYGCKVSRSWSRKLQAHNYRAEVFPVFPRDVVSPEEYHGTILTSATIDPEDIEFTTGIRGEFHRLRWNFDYSRVIFVVKEANPKRDDWEGKLRKSYEEIRSLHDRVLVLLTNRRHLKIFPSKNGVARQGEDSLAELIEKLRRGKIKVLVGLDSLWTGVDIKGEKGILMSKLPFDSPEDPVTFHRIRFLRERGEDPFLYQRRKAFLKFRQGVGRLMRQKEDSGTIVICDNRIWRYREFINFLKDLGVTVLYDREPTGQRTSGRPYLRP